LKCGNKIKEEETEAGKVLRVGGTAICSKCSAPILKMIEQMEQKQKPTTQINKPIKGTEKPAVRARAEEPSKSPDVGATWAVDVGQLDEKTQEVPKEPSGKVRHSGRLAAADEALKRRERLIQQVEVVGKKQEKKSSPAVFVVIGIIVVVVIGGVLFIQHRFRLARESALLSALKQKVEEYLERGEFEKALTEVSDFESQHSDLKEREEFQSVDTKASEQTARFFENAINNALKSIMLIERLVKLIEIKERFDKILLIRSDEKLSGVSSHLKVQITELRKYAMKELDGVKTNFEKYLLAFDYDGAEVVSKEWSENLEAVKKGLSEDERSKCETELSNARKRLADAVKELQDKWMQAAREGDEKENIGDYESAMVVYSKYCDVKAKSVSEAAKLRWVKASEVVLKRKDEFESEAAEAESTYKKGDLEKARDIYLKYSADGMASIRERAKSRLQQIEKEIAEREAKRKAFRSEYEANIKLAKTEPQKALNWCRETLKKINTIPISDAQNMVIQLRNEAYRELGFCPLPQGDFTVGSSDPFDENPQREARLSSGVYLEKYEVSNAEYKAFIDAGGYREKKYWSEEGWVLAEQFVDSTGKPGPSFWRNGTYPQGAENEPVRGISWYEAEAYAKWAGKRLPTAEEWEVAAGWDSAAQKILEYPWGDKDKEGVGNIGSGRPTEVKKDNGDISPSGIINMGGNVSEWTATVKDKNALVKGGNFIDSEHTASRVRFSEKLPLNARMPYVGFRCVKEEK